MAIDGETPPPTPPTKLDSSSPFFVGPQDRPGDLITPTKLKRDNYEDWAADVRTALKSKRKFGFLNGTYRKPEPPCTQDDWETLHAMLVSWIMNTIDPEVKTNLSKYDDAYLLWNHLKSLYSVVNGPRIQQLKSRIARCEQTATMPVSTYFGKLNVLWDELGKHEPIICCKCGLCKCELGAEHEKRREDNKLQEFLMGLYAPYYAQIRSNLLSYYPLPTLEKAFNQVIQEERVRCGDADEDTVEKKPEVVGFFVNTLGRGRGRVEKVDKSGLMCSHCKKSGHELVNCFDLLGYPEWWETRSQGRGSTGRGRGGGRGNSGRGQSVRANVADTGSGAQPVGQPLSTPPHGFSADQWKTLVAAFGNSNTSTDHLNGPSFEGADWHR
ncbi:uncharacterized protein [Spinacia oleracea]|uniref:Retrotransposon Copia-like N-terminal domain-containing protein n=1 Tax=Spinacia oleracea TaxID=3562 RepID=A0ABM3RDE6_SPIOL|nr:uncharacterized protein LOC130468077 [Spinacia oleracea]